jgi:hypothetical protein
VSTLRGQGTERAHAALRPYAWISIGWLVMADCAGCCQGLTQHVAAVRAAEVGNQCWGRLLA